MLARYDFDQGGLQFAQTGTWFGDLDVSYYVGVYGFSVWLIGMTSSCWPRRSRTRSGPDASGRARTWG